MCLVLTVLLGDVTLSLKELKFKYVGNCGPHMHHVFSIVLRLSLHPATYSMEYVAGWQDYLNNVI